MPLLKMLQRKPLTGRMEEAVRKQLQKIKAERRQRFRVLASLKDEESLYVARMAAHLADCPKCDIVLLFVRPVDRSGSIHVQLARRNILQAGVELPGLRILREGLEVLQQELRLNMEECETSTEQMNAWGDPVGDARITYTCPDGRHIVLKLKVAPEIASGILDQYELGPYNLIILGKPERWRRSGLWLLFHHVVAERVMAMAPCSVMIARDTLDTNRGFFIYLDGSARSFNGMRRTAILAHEAGEPVTLFAVAPTQEEMRQAQKTVDKGREILENLGIEVSATKTAFGDTVQQIVEHGNDHLVIAITDRGRTRLQRIFLGSIAGEVARLAKTSVLDVRLG